jgi:hypothetical protein
MEDTTRLFSTLLACLRDEGYTLILTVGRAADPSVLGSEPADVQVEHYIPPTLVL